MTTNPTNPTTYATERDALKAQLAAVTAERDALKVQVWIQTSAMKYIRLSLDSGLDQPMSLKDRLLLGDGPEANQIIDEIIDEIDHALHPAKADHQVKPERVAPSLADDPAAVERVAEHLYSVGGEKIWAMHQCVVISEFLLRAAQAAPEGKS